MGEQSGALEDYRQALQRRVAAGDRQGQALTLYGVARVERDRLNLPWAADRIEEATGSVESLRTKLSGHQLCMNYFAATLDYYALHVDVRMHLYEQTRSAADIKTALSASEKARAPNLLDVLSEAHADSSSCGVLPPLRASAPQGGTSGSIAWPATSS